MRYRDSQTHIDAAIRDTASRSVKSRVTAAEALGRAAPGQHTRAAEALRPLLDDESPDVRYMAALALGRLRDRGAVDRLTQMVAQEQEPMPHQAAVAALGDIADPRATAALCEALRSPSSEVRFQAATSLPRVAPRAAVVPLQGCLNDTDPEVRASAAAALGDLRHQDSRDLLAGVLERDDSSQVQMEAAMALSRMGDRRGTAVLVRLLRHRDLRLLAAEHLFRCPDPAARQPLRAALYRWLSPPLLKVWAAGALARLGDPLARQRLLQLLHHKNDPVRGLAIQVLGAIAQPWSHNALQSLLKPDEARFFGGWHDEIHEALRRVEQLRSEAPSA